MNAEREKISEQLLGELLKAAGTPLSPAKLRQLWRFHGFLRQQNPRLNLTRIYNFHNMVRKHYVDSLLVDRILKENRIPWPALTLDLGTGPGFPGIPLAIYREDRRFILAEGRAQRVDFLKEAVKVTGLTNTEVFGGRIHAGRGMAVDAVITRAVERMPATVERMLPFLKPGGLLIFMKGPHCDAEIAEGTERYAPWLDKILDEAYTLPDSRDHRRLVIWRRTENVSGLPSAPIRSGSGPGVEAMADRNLIFSRDNEKFKRIKSLHASRGIKKQNRALVCGLRVATEFLRKFPALCREVVLTEGWPRPTDTGDEVREFLQIREELDLPLHFFNQELFRELDLIGTGPPLLLIEPQEIEPYDAGTDLNSDAASMAGSKDTPGCTLFLPMGDPENLGAALRSAAAFEVNSCVLLKQAAHPYHPRALRAAAGATPQIRLQKGPELARLIDPELTPARSMPELFILDGHGEDIREVDFPPRFGLLAGPEGGLTALPDTAAGAEVPRTVRIPASPAVESLNTTVALSIALYILKEKGLA